MNCHPPKWLMYAMIIGFGVLLGCVLLIVISNDTEDARQLFIREQIKQSKDYRLLADSLEETATEQIKLTLKKKEADSLHYVHEKLILKNVQANRYKEYKAKLAAIDSATYLQFNSGFSIRQMLSDSSVEVWR